MLNSRRNSGHRCDCISGKNHIGCYWKTLIWSSHKYTVMPQLVTCGSEFLRINAQKNSIEYSSNGGRTWHNRFCMSSVGTFRDLLVMGADLFAATSKGLYWSRNGGATWVTRYNNSAVGEFQTLATDGAVLLAGTSKGLFVSRNQGMTWERRR